MEKKTPLPKHLTPASRKWARKILDAWVLEPHQVKLLVQAAEQLDRITEARERIKADGGPYFKNFRGEPRPHPALRDERDGRVTFARLVRELNLSEEAGDPRPPALRYR